GVFVVTFDDGYQNFHGHAWPVLRELSVPATVFLATSYLGGEAPFPFDDWRLAGSARVPPETWRPLSYAQLADILPDGLVAPGSQTHTHAVFRGWPQAFSKDLAASVALLRDRFGVAEPTFAFPYGITDPALAGAARWAGVRCGLTTQEQLAGPQEDPFTWGRF